MKNQTTLSITDLEKDLEHLITKKNKLIKILNEMNTALIGTRLQLEKLKKEEQYKIDQDRSRERYSSFDDE